MGPPIALVHEGRQLTKPVEIAECLSQFFLNKITELNRKIPVSGRDPLKTLMESIEKWGKSENREVFKLRKVSLLEVTTILGKLNNTTTMGNDQLDPMTLKLVACSITKPIQYILNISISTSTYCHKWKLGKLLPLFKGGEEN